MQKRPMQTFRRVFQTAQDALSVLIAPQRIQHFCRREGARSQSRRRRRQRSASADFSLSLHCFVRLSPGSQPPFIATEAGEKPASDKLADEKPEEEEQGLSAPPTFTLHRATKQAAAAPKLVSRSSTLRQIGQSARAPKSRQRPFKVRTCNLGTRPAEQTQIVSFASGLQDLHLDTPGVTEFTLPFKAGSVVTRSTKELSAAEFKAN